MLNLKDNEVIREEESSFPEVAMISILASVLLILILVDFVC
jgi:hypothetical protein